MTALRQIYPPAAGGGAPDLAALYAYPGAAQAPGRPWVRANMISSADGAAEVDGLSGGLSGAPDRTVFGLLRALADVILVGAGTVRAEQLPAGPGRAALGGAARGPPGRPAHRGADRAAGPGPGRPAADPGGTGCPHHRADHGVGTRGAAGPGGPERRRHRHRRAAGRPGGRHRRAGRPGPPADPRRGRPAPARPAGQGRPARRALRHDQPGAGRRGGRPDHRRAAGRDGPAGPGPCADRGRLPALPLPAPARADPLLRRPSRGKRGSRRGRS